MLVDNVPFFIHAIVIGRWMVFQNRFNGDLGRGAGWFASLTVCFSLRDNLMFGGIKMFNMADGSIKVASV
jgi:hypothetical protein